MQSSKQNSHKKKKKGDVLPELCVVASPLGPTTASPLVQLLPPLLPVPVALPSLLISVNTDKKEK